MAFMAPFILHAFSSLFLALGVLADAQNLSFEAVSVADLQPSTSFTLPRAKDISGERSHIEMVLRDSACSGKRTITKEARRATLARDALRVASIQKRVSGAAAANGSLIVDSHIFVLIKSGLNVGASSYAVTVTFGTPARNQMVIFDTGSDISWIQCKPCTVKCYKQGGPLFDPALSSTYRNFSCTSSACMGLPIKGCFNGNTCLYGVAYGDGSYTSGFLASDTLRMTLTDVLDDFMFGCGQRNQGFLKGFGGLLGLGRSPYALNSQAASKLGNIFSYCLPSKGITTGYLRLGNPRKTPAGYTPIVTDPRAPSLYFLSLIGITVAGKRLAIWPSVFQSVGTIIDSGTEITRLPPAAYSALKMAFRAAMTKYPLVAPFDIMDTCYDFRRYPTITFPIIRFHYSGLDVTVPTRGVFYFASASQSCLAFGGNSDSSHIAIIGNIQQRTMEVTYDNKNKKIRFSEGACS